MIDDMPEHGPGRKDRALSPASKDTWRGQLFRHETRQDFAQDLIRTVQQALGVIDRGQVGFGRELFDVLTRKPS
jgi:hypothetical protein